MVRAGNTVLLKGKARKISETATITEIIGREFVKVRMHSNNKELVLPYMNSVERKLYDVYGIDPNKDGIECFNNGRYTTVEELADALSECDESMPKCRDMRLFYLLMSIIVRANRKNEYNNFLATMHAMTGMEANDTHTLAYNIILTIKPDRRNELINMLYTFEGMVHEDN